MTIYALIEYVSEVGKENATWEGLREWKKLIGKIKISNYLKI